MAQTAAVVLAAGLGTRMKSDKPKVLHRLAGWPMIRYVIAALQESSVDSIIVVLGHQGELVEKVLPETCRVVYQREQLGTGHALLQALPELDRLAGGDCLVVCGDTPLLRAETLRRLREQHRQSGAKATVLTAVFPDPRGYGRIVRGPEGIERIVEEKDASPAEKGIAEINAGTYCFDIGILKERLGSLSAANAQGEYYLTDIVKMLVREQEKVETVLLEDHLEALGINDRVQLAEAGQILRRRILTDHMLRGVTVVDPAHTYVDAGVTIGRDTVLHPGVFLEGKTQVGEKCEIGPHTRVIDSVIADNVSITYSCLVEAKVASGCTIGPFSFLRPGSVLAENVKIGDFVELKKTVVGAGSKIPHLSYVGDSTLGENVNIGAGTITCNYDGFAKHPTVIGDGAFIGSNTNLVAPITVGPGAYIGAGSTVTKDIPAGALAIAREKQRNIENWKNRILKNGPK